MTNMSTQGEMATPAPKLRGAALGNRGNRRAGRTKGYRSQKGGSHQLSWRDDRIIQERIRVVVYPMWLRRVPAVSILPVVNVLMTQRGEPEIGIDTIYEDLKRCAELAAEEQKAITDKVVEHLAEYDYLILLMHQALSDNSVSAINRDRLYGYIMQAIDRKAKLDGSLDQGARHAGTDETVEMPPSPMEMVAKGLATREQLDVWLRFSASRSGAMLPAASAVIEGVVSKPKTVESVTTKNGASGPKPRRVKQVEDDGLDEIDPHEEEAIED